MRYAKDFVDFINMKESKQPDAIERNYLIECKYNKTIIRPSLDDDFVRCGIGRLGYELKGDGTEALKALQADLRLLSINIVDIFVIAYCAQFYNWHRIKLGELSRWPKRPTLAS